MKNHPRKGGHRSGKQGRRNPRFSGSLTSSTKTMPSWLSINLPDSPLCRWKDPIPRPPWSLLSADLKLKRQRAFVVHRIDRFTSGVLLFAKTEPDRDALVRQFLRSHSGEAVSRSSSRTSRRQRRNARSLLSAGRNVSKVDHGKRLPGGSCRTSIFRRTPSSGASLVRVTLVTGLQNQIRVQFSAIGHPVIGDRKYHPAEASERRIARVALHAAHLQFIHPRSGDSVSVDCELPPDFQSLLQALSPPQRPRR